MAASSLVSVICKKIIKPCVPTPLPLRSHKLASIDQFLNMSVSLAFFYPKTGDDHKSYEPTHVSQILEKSLSKALSFYYPYAGRLMKDGSSVDCNDMGVELSHARVHCSMSEILKHSYTNGEHVVFPIAQPYSHNEGNLAKAQVSYFDCGGIAVGGCLSHKIGDGCTISNFFNNWGLLSRDITVTPTPYFIGESIYPLSKDHHVVSTINSEEPEGYLGKRFVFPAAKVNALKSIFPIDSRIQTPVTRTEVVSALLYKCAIAARRATSGSFKPSFLIQVANMRQRLKPPLSQNACGNILSWFAIETTNERDVNCPRFVSEMRKEKEKLRDRDNTMNYPIIAQMANSLEELRKNPYNNNEVNNYICTSLTAFSINKTDFGWGRPARVSFATGPMNNFFFLMDNQSGGGVEAIIMLSKQDMSIFERNPELLEFAVPVPNN